MRAPLSAMILCLMCATSCCCGPATDPLLLRRVSSGLVQGIWQELKQQDSGPLDAVEKVAVWMSIPYGQAPVSALRWRPPLPALNWSGIRDASFYRPPCVQPDGNGNEDCLHVHITAPPNTVNTTQPPLPVLVYIHGGGLMDGGGEFEYMSAFALHANVVVVAVNYRLNVFGWLALKCLQESDGSVGNYGMRDVQLALQWVRSNIKAFGGDPDRVTLAGQSSGGTSIFALYSSPFSHGLFKGAISMSGSINITMNTAQAFLQNQVISDALQCIGNSTAECLRNASVALLVQAQRGSSWGATPGIFGLDKTSPSGLSPSKDWFGTLDNCVLKFFRSLQKLMRVCRHPSR
jgi:para-nitrobenzyl esterase